jgi:hypothetical protein
MLVGSDRDCVWRHPRHERNATGTQALPISWNEGNGNGKSLCIDAEHQMNVKGSSRRKTRQHPCSCLNMGRRPVG